MSFKPQALVLMDKKQTEKDENVFFSHQCCCGLQIRSFVFVAGLVEFELLLARNDAYTLSKQVMLEVLHIMLQG